MSSQFSMTTFLDNASESKVHEMFENFKTYFTGNPAFEKSSEREILECLLADVDTQVGCAMYCDEDCREILYLQQDLKYKTKLEELVHSDYHNMSVTANVLAMGPVEERR